MAAVHAALMLALVPLPGCSGFTWAREQKAKPDLGVAPRESASVFAALRDTVGALGYYEGLAPMRVRGYGLVVGLGKNGSHDCPKAVRDQLVQSMYKQHRFVSDDIGVPSIKPEQIIDDPGSAVVVVQGDIPPAAVEGTRFDVSVRALPGTQTKSLAGGRLFSTDLEVYRSAPGGTTVAGQVLARASGPLFLNPFSDVESATKANVLEARILGGGRATQDRRVRLVLLQPSYPAARRIQDRINARFPDGRKVADATSPSFVQLRIPKEFQDDAAHFLALARSLLVVGDPMVEASRARQLGQEILNPAAPHAQIALVWEGMGRPALPVVRDLYTHAKDYVSFHAAVAGLRLGDHIASDALGVHAGNPTGAFRFPAIRALGDAKGMASASMILRDLLHADDPRVRIAAYEALSRREDVTIHSRRIARDNFVLDHIPGGTSPMIYARRTGARRIAVFGDDPRCNPPILYRSPDGSVTLAADGDAKDLTVIRAVVSTGSVSPAVQAPLSLIPLLELMGRDADADETGTIVGLGLDYGAILRALHQLCREGAIDVPFVLEQPNAAELFGPTPAAGRPESEL